MAPTDLHTVDGFEVHARLACLDEGVRQWRILRTLKKWTGYPGDARVTQPDG